MPDNSLKMGKAGLTTAGKGETGVAVLLVLGLVLVLLPKVGPAPADAVADASLLVGQGGAEHAVHGAPVVHLKAATQPALVLLHPHTLLVSV